jgi:hypothetical protein
MLWNKNLCISVTVTEKVNSEVEFGAPRSKFRLYQC